MEGKEFYEQKEIPQEEIERLKRIEYPNFVSVAMLDGLALEGKTILDSGAGPNTRLAEFISKRGGMYVPMDIRSDVLADMKEKLNQENMPFYGVRGDVRALPFADKSFDIVHQRFVLMNIAL
jgi:ubiquinone/menaquinone biosynthesis C-methylase UbiE